MRKFWTNFGPAAKQRIILFVLFGLLVSGVFLLIPGVNPFLSIAVFFIAVAILSLNWSIKQRLKRASKIKKIERLFPDFLQLVSSNLRAGMTVDKAILLSAREEFDPLDKEILKAGKDITVGKSIEEALLGMSKRISSEKVSRVVQLILSGISSGGDLSILLDEAAGNMRSREFLEKKASSNVLMYVIFIFVAVSIGGPALFGLSNLLVEVLSTLLGNLPTNIPVNANVPFTLSKINISTTFILYYSIAFMIAINIMASLVLGLVSKGEEKEGLKFLPVMIALSIIVFFAIKVSLRGIVMNAIG